MPITRKIIKVGGSHCIAIPPSWLKYHEKKTGKPVDELLMELNGEITLYVEQEEKSKVNAAA